jgi:hypothetical protein
MKCMETNPLNAYMEGRLPQSESIRFEKHLESCKDCQLHLEQWISKHDDFEDSSEEEGSDEAFMQNIMDQLTPYTPSEETDLAEVVKKAPQLINWKKRSLDIMKKITVAAVGLAVVISLGTYVSPTFAEYVKSFFNSSEQVDPGMKNAYNEGFVKPLGLKVKDQGITLEVKEILADTLRIAIICEAKDLDGNPLDLEKVKDLQFIIKDVTGNRLIDPNMGGWATSKKGDQLMIERALTEAITGEKKLPDEVIVELSWKKIGEVSGNWVLNVPIDMVKAKAVTKTIEINKQYTTPQGLIIDLKRMDLAPSLTLLSLATQLTPEIAQQKKDIIIANGLTEELKRGEPLLPFMLAHEIQDYKVVYELLDQEGKLVAAWDEISDKNLSIRKNNINNGMGGLGDASGMKWWHAFAPLIDKPEQLTFKLYAIYTKELADFSIKLNLADLNKKQVETVNNGSKLTFSSFSVKEDEKETVFGGQPVMGKGGIINIQAELAKDIVGLSVWQAKDENGKEYNARLEKKSVLNEDGTVSFQGVLVIDQLLQQPKELTLSYHIAEKQNKDVNWQVHIDMNTTESTSIVGDIVKEKAPEELRPEAQQPAKPQPEPQQPAKPQPETQQPAKPQPETQQPTKPQPEPRQPVKHVNAEDETAIKGWHLTDTIDLLYISPKELKRIYNIDFIIHNAAKDKYGVYEMAFYDLKSQKVLSVIKFNDVEIGTKIGAEGFEFLQLSDGPYIRIEDLKKAGFIK